MALSVCKPLEKISSRGVSVCEIREPEETTNVKTILDKDCKGQRRIVGQAKIFGHPVVKNDLQQKLVGDIPSVVG